MSSSPKLVVLGLDLDIQQCLVVVALPPSLLEHLDLVLLQLPAGGLLQLAAADPLTSLLLTRGLDARLEARLHAHAHRRVERDLGLVAPHLGRRAGLGRPRRPDRQERVAQRLDLERPRRVGCREDREGLERRDGIGRRGQKTDLVAAKVPVYYSVFFSLSVSYSSGVVGRRGERV